MVPRKINSSTVLLLQGHGDLPCGLMYLPRLFNLHGSRRLRLSENKWIQNISGSYSKYSYDKYSYDTSTHRVVSEANS